MFDHDRVQRMESESRARVESRSEGGLYIPPVLQPLTNDDDFADGTEIEDLGAGKQRRGWSVGERIESWVKPMLAPGGNPPPSEDPRPF